MAFLLGMDHAGSDVELADDGLVKAALQEVPEPLPFKEAVKFLRDRVAIRMSSKAYRELDNQLRFRAFTVGRLAQRDAIEAVQKKLAQAIKDGKTVEQFWEAAGHVAALKNAGFEKSSPWYWENVFRTNVQTSYNAGRAMQFKADPPQDLEFIGITDARQTEICQERSGIRLPADDAWWESNWPPLHFACRSTVRGVYAAEAKILAVPLTSADQLKDLPDAQKSFGGNPIVTGSYYKLTVEMKDRVKAHGLEHEVEQAEKELLRKKK